MKKPVVAIVGGFFLVIVVIGVAFAWLQRGLTPPADAMQQPPCASTVRSQKSATRCSEVSGSAIPTVSFCDLLNDEERYKNRIVRTQTKLYGDSGDFALGDSSCGGENMRAHVEFDSRYGIAADAQQAFDDLLCSPGHYYANKEADAVVVGRFDGLDGKPGDRYRTFQFSVMCVQRAQNQRLTYGGT